MKIQNLCGRPLKTIVLAACISGAIFPLLPRSASADDYPARLITIIITFGSGSLSDIVARFYAHALEKTLHARGAVETRPGASGMIGARAAVSAAPDGYTILMGSGTVNALNYFLYRDHIDYAPAQFETVAILYKSPAILFANKNLPGNSAQELLANAKQSQARLSCGSGNSVTQVACEMLRLKTGTDIISVPYKGTAQSLTDVAGGQISFAFADAAAAVAFVATGAIRPVAVSAQSRLATLPDVPTFAEQGISDFYFISWVGLFVPAGTPKDIINKLNEVAVHLLASDKWERQREISSGIKVDGELKESQDFVASEIKKWQAYIEQSGIKGAE
jgi:tripartite-type tricarboxylate transporter receptor subunit TctC